MTEQIPPPTAGPVGGKYELVRMIGRGGMGSVWEARHGSLRTRFAIKFIEAEYADSEDARSRFDREARAAATIQSKHAIQIFDHGVTDDGKPYIVMELLEGEPLDKRLERLGRLDLAETARILQQVCRGLARAHEAGIIHRDLKPENIFLVQTSEDDQDYAKILDFGIAKVSGPNQPQGISASTKTGAVLGTPFYMSPEQARGLRNVDHRTDVWSIGVIAYKCVTGQLPFDGESVGDLLVKICVAPLPVPSHLNPGLPPSFDAWFQRALEREPDRRFGSVQELAEGLCAAAGIAPRMSAGQASPAYGSPANPHVFTPPSSGRTPGHGVPPNGLAGRTEFAAPGAITSPPYTTSQRMSAVSPGGKGKLLLGAFAGVAVLGVVGAAVAMKLSAPDDADTSGARLTPTTSSAQRQADALEAQEPPAVPHAPPEAPIAPAAATAASADPDADDDPPSPSTKPSPGRRPSAKPPKPTTATAVATTAPAPPPPPPAPTGKKPGHDTSDPGY